MTAMRLKQQNMVHWYKNMDQVELDVHMHVLQGAEEALIVVIL